MRPNDIVKELMELTETSYKELAEYSGVATRSNLHAMLGRSDIRAGVLARLLETMGYQLVVQSVEDPEAEEYVVECE